VSHAVLTKRVGKNDMEELLKVVLLGKGDDEETTTTKSGESDEEIKSRQLSEDPFGSMAQGEFVPPKYNPTIWAQAPTQNTRLARCIRSYARNTVGLGWHIEPLHPITPETPDKERKVVEEQTEALRSLFGYPNDKMPFSEIAYLSKHDEEATGNGYWEVVRNNSGKIVRLFHVPTTTVRKRMMKGEDGEGSQVYGYVQIRGNQKSYFKEFGEKRVMSAKTGKWAENVPPGERATEILHFLIYDPTSSYYGAPRYVPASTAIAGNRQSAIRNVNFFENDAVPRMALLVSGGKLTQDSMQQIEDFFRGKQKGVDQAHRVMIIQVEPSKVGFQQQNKTAVELKPLTVGVTEDASFQTYRSANDEEVREIFGLAPVFFSTENVNKASAAVSREITNEQEFEPDRLAKEYIINQTVVADTLCALMGNNPATPDDPDEMEKLRKNIRVQFRFARLTLTDPLDQARMDQIYASLAALTPNELRERIGKAPFPKDYFFAEKPLPIAMAELSAGLALAIALKDEEAPQPEGAEGEGGEAPPEEMPLPEGLEPLAPTDAEQEGAEIEVPSPGESAEVPEPQRDPKAPKTKVPGSLKMKPSGAKIDRQVVYNIASELMADARRLVMMGANRAGGTDE
jgi:PBSX family phage portal protein